MRLSPLTYLGFATPGFFMALVSIPTYITLQKFYVDDLGVATGTVALVLGLSRLIDAVTDPIIGWLSDRLRSPLGRRKPFMLLGAVLCGVSLWPLLQPAGAVGGLYLFGWISLFYLGAAFIQVPYTAWTADLTKDYAARTRLASAGQLALLLGTVTALAVPALGGDTPSQLYILAIFALVALPLSILPAVVLVREPPVTTHAHGRPFDALSLPLELPILRRFALAYALNALGNTLPLTLTLFYFQYVLQLDPALPLLLYFGAAIGFVPLWTYVGNRFGRDRAWRFAILATTILQAPAALLTPETAWVFYGIAIIVGGFLAADFTLPQAIQGDLADLDQAMTRQERAGTHYALWSLVVNIATAGGAALALWLLALAGFVAGAETGSGATTQSPQTITAIALIYAGLPALFKLPAFTLMGGFAAGKVRMTDLAQQAPHGR